MFPVFQKVRENARRASCQSNEKQIALAFTQYTQDTDETLPTSYLQEEGTGTYWPKRVYPYIKSLGVFKCPDDSGNGSMAASFAAEPHPAVNVSDYGCESYGYNIALNGDATINPANGISLAKINNPSDLCLIAENSTTLVAGQNFGVYFGGTATAGGSYNTLPFDTGTATLWYSGSDTPIQNDVPWPATGYNSSYSTPIARHTGGCNIAYLDGHVKWLRFSDVYTLPANVANKANFKLWHPDAQ